MKNLLGYVYRFTTIEFDEFLVCVLEQGIHGLVHN
jgi:hypothetical protein